MAGLVLLLLKFLFDLLVKRGYAAAQGLPVALHLGHLVIRELVLRLRLLSHKDAI
jgi:hypothetical protein